MIRHLATAVLAFLLVAASASASPVIGSQDGPRATAFEVEQSATFSRVARVLVDPSKPLASYDETIAVRRAAGMKIQLVLGGLYAGPAPTASQARAAADRWEPWAVSIVNEPENARSPWGNGWGQHLCSLARRFGPIYRTLKAAGVPHVLFGEFAPTEVERELRTLGRCHVRVVADGLAYHPYDHGHEGSIENTRRIVRQVNRIRRVVYTPRRFALPLFWTEYGVRGQLHGKLAERKPVERMREALRVAKRYRVSEINLYGVHDPGRTWDTALFNVDGSPRAVASVFSR